MARNNHEAKTQKERKCREMSLALGTTFSLGKYSTSCRDALEAEKLSRAFNKHIRQGGINEILGPAKERNLH